MNGAGNDFVVCDNRSKALDFSREIVARLCDRHRGIGADGLLAVEPPESGGDFRMRYYNSDGGEAEMCGNGARCFARYAARLLPQTPAAISFETQAGLIRATFQGSLVTVNMSDPVDFRPPAILEVHGEPCSVHFLNTGVPHAVVFVDNAEAVNVRASGAALRFHPAFAPKGANANFAEVLSPGSLLIRTYERGVEDETLACGTGVCAAALLHHVAEGTPSPVSVKVRGGDTLQVSFERTKKGTFQNVALTGPADFVFDGHITV